MFEQDNEVHCLQFWHFLSFLSSRKCSSWCHLRLCSVQVTASCPAVCECPTEPLVCPPGVSAVPDGCGCCKVCAAQLNQDCSSTRPCDHHKGLECNYGNDVTMAWGICRGKRGRKKTACWVGRNFTLKNEVIFTASTYWTTYKHFTLLFKTIMVNVI